MKRLLVRAGALMLILAVLGFALRHDLIEWNLRQGDVRLRAGDAAGAAAALRQANLLGATAAPLAFNLGVSRYRKGDYANAREYFSTALSTASPRLAAAIHFNLGNSAFRQAETVAGRDQPAANRLFRIAMADYARALALAPEDADALNNRSLAQIRLEALTPKTVAAADRQAGRERNGVGRGERKPSGDSQAGSLPGKPDTGKENILAPGKTRRDVSMTEAERLLNEARGRERPAMPLLGESSNGSAARPDKDW